MEHLVRMGARQLKSWLKRAKSLLRRYTPQQLGLRSFYAPATSVKKGSMLYTTVECRGDIDTHCKVVRPVADLVGSTQVMVRERPIFCIDKQQKHNTCVHNAVCSTGKTVLIASVREGCTASEAMQFTENRGVSIDEYEVLMPCGLQSGCSTRQAGSKIISTRGKHIMGDSTTSSVQTYNIAGVSHTLRRAPRQLVLGVSRNQFHMVSAASRQWHRSANLAAEVQRAPRRRCAKRQRNVALMFGRSQASESASMRARAIRERKNSSSINHKKRQSALKAKDNAERTEMSSALQHIKKKVRPTKIAARQKQVRLQLHDKSAHRTTSISSTAQVAAKAGGGVGAGLSNPERTARQAASGDTAQLVPLLLITLTQKVDANITRQQVCPVIATATAVSTTSAAQTGAAGSGPHHPERATVTVASGGLVSGLRKRQSESHHSNRQIVGVDVTRQQVCPVTATTTIATSASSAQADAAGAESHCPGRTTVTVASGNMVSSTRKRKSEPHLSKKKPRGKLSNRGTKHEIDLTRDTTKKPNKRHHTSTGRGSVNCADMQLQLQQSGLPPSPSPQMCRSCRRMVCLCESDV